MRRLQSSVDDIDHILLGPRYTAGSALLQLRAFFTATFDSHSQDCLLSFSVLMKGLGGPLSVFLSIHQTGKSGRLSSDSLRHQPPSLQEHGVNRFYLMACAILRREQQQPRDRSVQSCAEKQLLLF
ncbi:unnamed protein product [Pleuronectes platessa]|uniref:Uncharacterized protein n=1 Tax=Pleuronectes platessa TaxID=8262 RepID=A0A9N7U0T4_PLEPL|nr:unnamed protein product [Pleuronectes platessa]